MSLKYAGIIEAVWLVHRQPMERFMLSMCGKRINVLLFVKATGHLVLCYHSVINFIILLLMSLALKIYYYLIFVVQELVARQNHADRESLKNSNLRC